ncbi:MAG: precorrin-3B C(17)-methyltransferase [Candidatus Omnitrophota bacterium]|nr:precorrin-3B C(17)-methyltransferase [Candidatus Omnitrophota bacterium]
MGPGDLAQLSRRAYEALNESQVIVGYSTYIKLLGKIIAKKELISFGMTQEIIRANEAIKKALEGRTVCVISSGDPGIYGMAGLILELLKNSDIKKLRIEIIPGITAASASASLLGAPLAQDFAVISLSDLLVSRQEIEKKLKYALKADFVIVLYNPKSKSRVKPLKRAWSIIRQYRAGQTPVGIVRDAYRDCQNLRIIRLKDVNRIKGIDMTTTIIVGNSRTFVKGRYMVTRRGYKIKNVFR